MYYFMFMYVDVLIRSVKKEIFMSKKNFPVKFKTKCVWTLSPFSVLSFTVYQALLFSE